MDIRAAAAIRAGLKFHVDVIDTWEHDDHAARRPLAGPITAEIAGQAIPGLARAQNRVREGDMGHNILAIDQGTTNTKALVIDPAGRILARGSQPTAISYPQPGWVEQDALRDLALHAARRSSNASRRSTGPTWRPWGSRTSARRQSSGIERRAGRLARAWCGNAIAAPPSATS